MGAIKDKYYEIMKIINDLLMSGVELDDLDDAVENNLVSPDEFSLYLNSKEEMLKELGAEDEYDFDQETPDISPAGEPFIDPKTIGKYKNPYNESLNEGADWILLRSGNVVVDSWDGFFMKLDEKGHPDLTQEVTADDPEYEEIYNKLNDRDRETVDQINNQEFMDESLIMPKLYENGKKKERYPDGREKYPEAIPGINPMTGEKIEDYEDDEDDEESEKEYKRDVVYHGRSEMPEDLDDDETKFQRSKNPDEEAPQSYEDWLDDVFLRIAVHYDWDVTEDYTRELFKKYEDELTDIYEGSGDIDEAAELVIQYDEEENAEEYGKWCDECGSELKDGVCPDCGWTKDDIDESLIMPRMNEEDDEEAKFDEMEKNMKGYLKHQEEHPEEFEEDDEDDGDELSDYEWEVGAHIAATLEENGVEYDEDNLSDALWDYLEEMRENMKAEVTPEEFAEVIMNMPKFMKKIAYDDMDESLNEAKKKKRKKKHHRHDNPFLMYPYMGFFPRFRGYGPRGFGGMRHGGFRSGSPGPGMPPPPPPPPTLGESVNEGKLYDTYKYFDRIYNHLDDTGFIEEDAIEFISELQDWWNKVDKSDPEYQKVEKLVNQFIGPFGQKLIDEDISESIDEGCCPGSKKHPKPTIIRRPTPIKRPLIKKLHERFTEKSDPIEDLGISVNPKREAKKFMLKTYGNLDTIAEMYFNDRKMEGPAYVIHKFFKNILEGKKLQDAFYEAAEDENFYGNKPWISELRKKVTDAIQKHHRIQVNPEDPRLIESLDEEYIIRPLRDKDDMEGIRALVTKLVSIINTTEKRVNMKVSEMGLGRDDSGYCLLKDTLTKTQYVFLISPKGDVTYRGVYRELPKRNDPIGNINDEKSIKNGLYRYLRFGTESQYESKK